MTGKGEKKGRLVTNRIRITAAEKPSCFLLLMRKRGRNELSVPQKKGKRRGGTGKTNDCSFCPSVSQVRKVMLHLIRKGKKMDFERSPGKGGKKRRGRSAERITPS